MSSSQSNQTVTYTFISNYLVWLGLALNIWMCFCPFLWLRRKPAQLINWLSKTIGLTESFRPTTMFLIGAIIMLALEYRNMEARQRGYYECKDRGISMHGCNDEVGVKWRAERNFWMVGFNLLCWLMVDRLSERIKMEETYQAFLGSKKLDGEFAKFYADKVAQAAAEEAAAKAAAAKKGK